MTNHERDLQKKAIDYLKTKKVYYINKFGDGWTAKGAPDLFCCFPYTLFVVFELKVGNNHLSDAQKIHRKRILSCGGLFYSPYTFEEFKSIVDELLERRMKP